MRPARIWILVLLLSVIPIAAQALDVSTRPVSPVHVWSAGDLERFAPEWIHMKLAEGSDATISGGRFVDRSGSEILELSALLDRAALLDLRPTFDVDRATARAWKAAGEARSGVTGPDLSLWFDLRIGGGPQAVARLINDLNALAIVEIAHPEPVVEPAVILSGPECAGADRTEVDTRILRDGPRTPDFTGQQVYLGPSPNGLDAAAAWAHPGGFGQGIKFIDVELCWTENHEDFNFANLFHVGGAAQDPSYEAHGTAVLGEVIGQQNGFGINGFAPAVLYGVVAVTVAEWPTVPHRFQEAVDNLDPGDAWLIELQMYPPGRSATPMEWLQVNYDVIWTSVWSRGIQCIEAGANGTQNLDDPSWGGVFNRLLRDSGATMVAAGTPYGLTAEWFTNWGSRMDVHAWGSAIVTTGYGDLYDGGSLQTRYTDEFGGTSGASPMVTGSALVLQGIALSYLGYTLDPIAIRSILHDTGVAHQGAKYIGPRPNLRAAVPRVLALADAPIADAASGQMLRVAPNPSRTGTAVRLDLSPAGATSVLVLDPADRRVRTLGPPAGPAAGLHLLWDGRDEAGREMGSGVYLLRIVSERGVEGATIQRIR